MTNIDLRLRYLGALVLFVIGGLSIMNALEYKQQGKVLVIWVYWRSLPSGQGVIGF